MSGEKNFKKRYMDRRGAVGQRSRQIVDSLVQDLGGEASISTAQRIILADLPRKLGVLAAIGEFIEKQTDLISANGDPLPPIRRSYLAFTNSIRHDLALLSGLKDGKKKPARSALADYLKSRETQP
jgi:hypothetical protein